MKGGGGGNWKRGTPMAGASMILRGAVAVSVLALALAGCGGGGTVNSTPAPSPAPTPAPTPTPTPTPSPTPTPASTPPAGYVIVPPGQQPVRSVEDDTEYRRNYVSFAYVNALYALANGWTGKGVQVAVLEDRKSVVEGKSVSVRGDLGGRRIL